MDFVLENICRIMQEKKISASALCKKIGLTRNNFFNWKSGHSRSYLKILPNIASALGVSLLELYGIDLPEPENIIPTQEETEFLVLYRSFSYESRERIKRLFVDISLGK